METGDDLEFFEHDPTIAQRFKAIVCLVLGHRPQWCNVKHSRTVCERCGTSYRLPSE